MAKAKKSATSRIINAIGSVFVVLILLLLVLLMGMKLAGILPFAVLSGSMEPTYHTGSLIYVKPVDPFTLQEGEVITFMLDEDTLATHRIVDIVPDENDSSVIRFQTKGDANDFVDGTLVHYRNVVGTPIFTIPYMGYIVNFIKRPPGLYVAIAFCAFFVLLAFLPDLFDEEQNNKKSGGNKKKKKTAKEE